MITQEVNDRLTRVGPGTPMGELMRRYWHPCRLARRADRGAGAARAAPRRGPHALPGPEGTDRPDWQGVRPPRHQPCLRHPPRERAAVRLPRLDLQRRGQGHRHALRARLSAAQGQGLPRGGARRTRLDLHGSQRRRRCCRDGSCWSGPTSSARSGSAHCRATGSSAWTTPSTPSTSSTCTGTTRTTTTRSTASAAP